MVSSCVVQSLGSSLPVPSVQELAKQPLIMVPPRYVRQDQSPSVNVNSGSTLSLPTVPIIDLQKLVFEETADLELQKLHSACKDWGFFQLVNHGVSSSLIGKMRSETENLFKLASEEKKRFSQQPGDLQGFGQAFVFSDEQKLDWHDMFYLVTLPLHLRNHSLVNKLPPAYRETLEAYILEIQKLSITLLGLMAKALEMDEEEMIKLFEDGYQAISTNYYPQCPQPELVIGRSPHSDAAALTILLQVNEVQGLEIKKDGMWIPVEALPNALIVNIGDLLEIISNGAYRSILHRAMVNSVQERMSIATFTSPKLTAEVGPSLTLINPQNPPMYRQVVVKKYFKEFLGHELKAKSLIDTLKIDH